MVCNTQPSLISITIESDSVLFLCCHKEPNIQQNNSLNAIHSMNSDMHIYSFQASSTLDIVSFTTNDVWSQKRNREASKQPRIKYDLIFHWMANRSFHLCLCFASMATVWNHNIVWMDGGPLSAHNLMNKNTPLNNGRIFYFAHDVSNFRRRSRWLHFGGSGSYVS